LCEDERQQAASFGRRADEHHAPVLSGRFPPHDALRLRAIGELGDRALREPELLGQDPDRGRTLVPAFEREQ
jgi:hypothetical protein